MARARNPYSGTYKPSQLGMGKEDLVKGLKGIAKVKSPNKHLTSNAYKTGLKKEHKEDN